ncbi:hypothetical protein K9M48_04940 [Candidatus Gracilibacteria bacterium]|nr:hypothetical protein [Candidatus Gracilibacteria bacterium]
MGKKVSSEDRKKLVSKIGQTSVEKKKKKLKHPPKVKKERITEVDLKEGGVCCKKKIMPKVKIDQGNIEKEKNHVPKKIKVIRPKPIHIGQAVL